MFLQPNRDMQKKSDSLFDLKSLWVLLYEATLQRNVTYARNYSCCPRAAKTGNDLNQMPLLIFRLQLCGGPYIPIRLIRQCVGFRCSTGVNRADCFQIVRYASTIETRTGLMGVPPSAFRFGMYHSRND
jgi:hypothetical protein